MWSNSTLFFFQIYLKMWYNLLVKTLFVRPYGFYISNFLSTYLQSFFMSLLTYIWGFYHPVQFLTLFVYLEDQSKVEKIWEDNLDSIPSPSTSVKIQIKSRKVCLRCKGKTLLGIVNNSPSNVFSYCLK